MWTLLLTLLTPPALAEDSDGDGVDSAEDCDDADPEVWRVSAGTSVVLDDDAEVETFCEGYCARDLERLDLVDISTTLGLECVTGATEIEIDAPELPSLAGLRGLQEADSLVLYRSDLVDLQGLESLESLGGLYVGCPYPPEEEDETDTLEDLAERCMEGSNPALASFYGLGPVTRLDALYVGAAALSGLNGLHRLESVDQLALYDQDGLSSLTGLDALSAVEELWIGHSGGLLSLRGLGALTEVRALSLVQNAELRDLRGLETLAEASSIRISGARPIKDLQGLEGLGAISTGLWLHDLPSLRDLRGLEAVTTLGELSLSFVPGLQSLSGLEGLSALDALRIGCKEPEGRGSRAFRCAETPLLSSLSALSSLTSANEISLVRLPALSGLDGLGGLTALEALELDGTGIADLSGLEGLTTLDELSLGCHLDALGWDDDLRRSCLGNASLSSLDGLDGLSRLGTLRVVNNPSLSSLDGLEGISRVDQIDVAGNALLERMDGLGPLSRVSRMYVGCTVASDTRTDEGEVQAYQLDCPGSPALTTLPTVTDTSVGSVVLARVPELSSLGGLEAITSLGELLISGATSLEDLSEIARLSSLDVLVLGCHPVSLDSGYDAKKLSCVPGGGLTSLSGLEGLDSLDTLTLRVNDDLSDVSALHGLSSAGDVTITNNRNLATTDALALVAEIDRVTGTTTISGNGP